MDTPAGLPIAHLRMTVTPEMIRGLGSLPHDEIPLLHLVGELDGIAFAQEGTYRIVTSVDDVTADDYPLVVVPAQLELVLVEGDTPTPSEPSS